jgi:hypothetical protein
LTCVVVSPCGVLDWSIELGELLVAVYILISNADFKFPKNATSSYVKNSSYKQRVPLIDNTAHYRVSSNDGTNVERKLKHENTKANQISLETISDRHVVTQFLLKLYRSDIYIFFLLNMRAKKDNSK